MKLSGKIAVGLLSAALLLAGCSTQGDTWVFRSGDAVVPPGLYIMHQIRSYAEAEQKIAADHESDADFETPKQSAMLKLPVEGQTASGWISAQAREKVFRHIAVKRQFAEKGLELNESDINSVEGGLNSLKSQSGDFYEKNGISDDSIREYYSGLIRENMLFEAIYGSDGEKPVSDDELMRHFDENYAVTDAMPISLPTDVPEGETKSLEELKQETKAAAEDYLARLKAGEEIEELMYDWQLKNADEAEKESVSKPEKGDLRVVLSEAVRSSYGDEMVDAAFSAVKGEPQLVETPDFIAVFNRIEPAEAADIFETYRLTLLRELKEEEFQAGLDEWAAAAAIEENTSALGRYKPEKLKLEME